MKNTMIPLIRTACGWLAILSGLTVGLMGCGSQSVKKAIDKAKTAVNNTATKMQQKVVEASRPSASSISLVLENREEPLVIEGGKANIAALKGRPLVVNIESTVGAKGEYPKFFLSLHHKGTAVAELVGKSHDANIYFQETPNGLLYATQLAKPAKVLISAGDELYVVAKLENAELQDVSGQAILHLKGDLTALVPQPKKKEEPKAEDKASAPVSPKDKMKAAEGGKK
jgi:hypothetical protein